MPNSPADSRLLLASASPRRAQLLAQIGVPFCQRPVALVECRHPSESARAYVLRLAREKAEAGRQWLSAGEADWVLGADTLVLAEGGEVLEKPRDLADFHRMMALLCGSEHRVLTAVCLADSGRSDCQLAETRVCFRSLGRAQIDAYWRTGEPQDKAGGYGIQGRGAVLVEAINGSYSNVVGLPLETLAPMLEQAGIHYWQGACGE
ncbi:nucleoside triphosphate pyrophosphatase [Microbulbifer sp. 2201CG32-9]|uniref:Maf family protein n=1 Tax=unclassified Microbulbifer TaxID=2619833 RepID=UPI00345BFA37